MTLDEHLLPIVEAVERVTGRRLHISTCHRWRSRGVAGVRLQSLKLGGRRVTSVEAVRRFLAEATAASDGSSIPAALACDDRVARAEAELDRHGV